MKIPHALSLVIQRSHSLKEILDRAVDIVAEELGTDVCSIYLLDPVTHRLILMATHGLEKSAVGKVSLDPGQGLTGKVVAEMRSLAVEDASSHPGYLYFPETREERFKSYLGVPMAIRSRPVGAIVVQTRETRTHEREDIETLYTIAAQLVGVVETARLIDALDRGEGGAYLEEVRSWHRPPVQETKESPVDVSLRGSAASPGIAMAEAVIRGSFDFDPDSDSVEHQGDDAEKARVRDALEKTRNDLLRIQKEAEKEADEEHALIFSSHLLLLNDPVLLAHIDENIAGGAAAPVAVARAIDAFTERLRQVSDPYIQERVEDILDLRSRILGYLIFGETQQTSVSDRIVIARGTPPSLVVELKAKGARALVTETGGPTSHGALLARSMGIPAVTGVPEITRLVKSGDRLIVDGSTGTVMVNANSEIVDRYEVRARLLEEKRLETMKYCNLPARTADGRRVQLLANISVAADLALAKKNGAEGIGLYRTEFPFIIREGFPTREEQVRIYRRAYAAFPDEPIHFRLLDLGADKFLPRGSVAAERDPFRGYRSIRVLLDYPEVLRNQVQAFALAAGQKPLSILIPMVSSVEEVRRARTAIEEAVEQLSGDVPDRAPRIGVMIELPAAVEIARQLAKLTDFLSIGTNDLLQYSLAIDREDSRLAAASTPYHPALLSMIRRTITAGHGEGKPVSLCGEMAADWRLAVVMLAMGIDSLSLSPTVIPVLKQALASTAIEPLEKDLDALLALPVAADAEEWLREKLPG